MDWYNRVAREATVNSVATRAGVIQTTLRRQLMAGKLSADTVLAIARGYGVNVLDALVESGFITADEVRKYGQRPVLANATDAELAAEIMSRAVSRELDGPIS